MSRGSEGVTRDPELAKDAVQEAFASALDHVDAFRGDARLSTWLHRIVYTKSIDRSVSPEQPTLSEQTSKSAAKINAPTLLPHTMERQDSAVLRIEAKRLKCAMVGHLLLLSSARDSAGDGPGALTLISRRLGRGHC